MKQWDFRGMPSGTTQTVTRRSEPDTTRIVESDVSISVKPTLDSLRVLVDQLPAVLWTTDEDLSFTSAVGTGLLSLGLGPNQIVGMSLLDFFSEQDSPAIDAHRSALAGEAVTYRMLWGERIFHAQVAALRDANGETIGTICVGVDGSQPDGETWEFLAPG